MTKSGRFSWGLLGASNVAREWMHGSITRHPECEVVSVYSRNPERAAQFKQELGLQRSFTNLAEFLADPELDAVYISTTNERHREEAIAAASAGLHILCEKPLALSADDAREMVARAQAAGVVFATNHHLRNLETHRTIREVIRSGELGTISSARISFTVGLPEHLARWRLHDASVGGGALLDLTVHDLDLLRFYFDFDPLAVCGMGLTSQAAAPGIKDNLMTTWEFPGGLLVSCQDSFLVPAGGTAVEIHGSRGSVRGEEVLWQKPQGRVTVTAADGSRRDLPIQHRVPYDRTINDFMSATLGQGQPSASGADGIRSLELALCAARSIQTCATIRL